MRYIRIPETLLPISEDIEIGQHVNLRIGVNIEGPTLFGYSAMVTNVESISIDSILPEDVSKPDFS